MSEICKHKSIKNRPYKSNNGSRIYFTGRGNTLSLSYYFKSLCISVIKKQGWKLIVRFAVKIGRFCDRHITFCESLEPSFHADWDISLNNCKILCTSWFSCDL